MLGLLSSGEPWRCGIPISTPFVAHFAFEGVILGWRCRLFSSLLTSSMPLWSSTGPFVLNIPVASLFVLLEILVEPLSLFLNSVDSLFLLLGILVEHYVPFRGSRCLPLCALAGATVGVHFGGESCTYGRKRVVLFR